MRASIFPPGWTTPTAGTEAASRHLQTAVQTLEATPATTEAVTSARSAAMTAIEILQKEPETVVPAHFAAAQAEYGVTLLDEAMAAGPQPTPSLVDDARSRFEQAIGALPG